MIDGRIEELKFEQIKHSLQTPSPMLGYWISEIDEDCEPRLYGDKQILDAIGISDNNSPEDCYRIWRRNIFSSHVALLQENTQKIINGEQGAVNYPWLDASGQLRYIRTVAKRDFNYHTGIRICGYCLDITDMITDEKAKSHAIVSSEFLLQTLSTVFEAVHIINFKTAEVIPVKSEIDEFWMEREITIEKYKSLLKFFFIEEDGNLLVSFIENQNITNENGMSTNFMSKTFRSNFTGKEQWYNVLVGLDQSTSDISMVIAFRDVSEKEYSKKVVQELKITSEIDGLTKVLNRITIEKKIDSFLENNTHEHGLLLLLDLDHFKVVNDVLGHIEGDYLLIETAEKLKQFCRSTDYVGRLGGDEFVVFFKGVTVDHIHPLVSRMIENIRKTYQSSGRTIQVTASVGVAQFPKDGTRFFELYHCADLAMYHAKNHGKNKYTTYHIHLDMQNQCNTNMIQLCNEMTENTSVSQM